MENYNSLKIHQQQLEQNLEILDIRFEHRIWRMLNPKTIWFTQMYTDTVSTRMIPFRRSRSNLGGESFVRNMSPDHLFGAIILYRLYL